MNIGQNYLETKIMTASPEQLVVIMYEEAIKALQLARNEIEAKDFAKANHQLYKAQLIIGELMSALNFDYKEIADNLFNVYSHVYDQIVQANMKKDIMSISALIKLLTALLEPWREAAKKVAIEMQSNKKALTY